MTPTFSLFNERVREKKNLEKCWLHNIKANIEPNIKPDLLERAQALKAKLIV